MRAWRAPLPMEKLALLDTTQLNPMRCDEMLDGEWKHSGRVPKIMSADLLLWMLAPACFLVFVLVLVFVCCWRGKNLRPTGSVARSRTSRSFSAAFGVRRSARSRRRRLEESGAEAAWDWPVARPTITTTASYGLW